MKITTNNTQTYNKTHNPNFGWLPICRGNILKTATNGAKTRIPVDVCLLGKDDLSFIEKFDKNHEKFGSYGQNVLFNFSVCKQSDSPNTKKYSFFMLIPSTVDNPPSFISKYFSMFKKKTTPKPLCFAMLEKKENKTFQLSLIETATEILTKNKSEFNEKISGVGQVTVYGISKFVKAMGGNKLEFYSNNHGFYENIFHLTHLSRGKVSISNEQLTKFIKETKKKYKINDNSKTLPQRIVEDINVYKNQ